MDLAQHNELRLAIRAALLQLGTDTLRDLGGEGAARTAALDVAADEIAARLVQDGSGVGDAQPEAAAGRSEEHRVSRRVELPLAAEIRQSGGAFVPATVLDLSTHGFRLETHLWFSDGATLWLRLPGLEARRAKIAWIKGAVIGCAFEEPLHEAVLDLVVRKSREA